MRIVIWTGAAYEPWGRNSINTGGIGGSETAAVHMAQHLATCGNDVFLFGEHDGYEEAFTVSEDLGGERAVGTVRYVDYKRAMKEPAMLSSDVFVSSRDKRVLRLKFEAALKILWVHDIHVGDDWENEIASFDRVYALTKWHRHFLHETYAHLEPEKVLITRNGIDPTRFEPKTPWPLLRARKGPRFVWSSSLDRGLDVMLDLWPKVRAMRDDATLEIYYGVDNWRKINAKNPKGLAIIDYFMKRIASMEGDGVQYHGRVGQRELAAAHMGALVWAYPTAWMETSCQLAGTLIFTRDGMRKIEDIKVGDQVLTHKGRFRPVTKLIRKEYRGDLFAVKRKMDFRPIVLTAEHPLRVATFHRRSDAKGGRNPYNFANEKFAWKVPGDVVAKLDRLVTPPAPCGELKSVKISDYVDMPVRDGKIGRNHNNPLRGTADNTVPITSELMWMLGFFAGDGSATRASKRKAKHEWFSAITFAHHTEEKPVANRIGRFFKEIGRAKTKPTSPHGSTTILYNSPWANFLNKTVGVSVSKRVPPFLWECSREHQAAFITGFFEADGSSPRERRSTQTTISPSLAYGLACLLAGQGLHPSISYASDRRAYSIAWTVEPKLKQFHPCTEGIATRVEKVTRSHYEGLVYNFEVEEDESYVTDRTAVHNCITALEAQAAGAYPITSSVGALPETVHSGFLVSGGNKSDGYQALFLAYLREALVGDRSAFDHRTVMDTDLTRQGNREFVLTERTWDGVADQWLEDWAKLLDAKNGGK